MLCRFSFNSLWRVGHGETNKVSTGHGEESHDSSEGSVMGEVDGHVGAHLDITEHEQRDEDHPGDDQDWEEERLFTRLRRKKKKKVGVISRTSSTSSSSP